MAIEPVDAICIHGLEAITFKSDCLLDEFYDYSSENINHSTIK